MDSDRLEDRIVPTLNKTSCGSDSSSLQSHSRQRSFASVIILSEPFQDFPFGSRHATIYYSIKLVSKHHKAFR